MKDPEMLTTGQVARLCGVTPDAVLKWIKKGKLPAVRTAGGHFRVARSAVEKLGYIDAEAVCVKSEKSAGESVSIPRHCWEYFCRNMTLPDQCRECIVYRARIERCYEVADLGETIGHSRRFCRASCEQCLFYRACKGLAVVVLVVTDDQSLQERLEAESVSDKLIFRFARSGYESAVLVDSCQPSVVILDSRLAEVADGRLIESMLADQRLAAAKLILALRRGDRVADSPHVELLQGPLTAARIVRAVEAIVYGATAAAGSK